MGCFHLAIAVLALTGEPPAEHVRLETRLIAPDALTGLGKVLTEPTVITQSGRPATLKCGESQKLVTDEDGTDRKVFLGLTIELTPVVCRIGQGVVVKLSCVVSHTVSTSAGVATRTVRRDYTLPSGERQVFRLPGEGQHAPMTVVVTPHLVEQLDAKR